MKMFQARDNVQSVFKFFFPGKMPLEKKNTKIFTLHIFFFFKSSLLLIIVAQFIHGFINGGKNVEVMINRSLIALFNRG